MRRATFLLFAAVVCLLPSLAFADAACTTSVGGVPCVNFIEATAPDGGGTVTATNFTLVASAMLTAPETFLFAGQLPAAISGVVTANYNIFDKDGVTLSDTMTVIAFSNAVTVLFQSDTEGGPALIALPGGTSLIETGQLQYVPLPSALSGKLLVGFQSDIETTSVAEPGSVLLLLSMITLTGGFFGVVKFRRT